MTFMKRINFSRNFYEKSNWIIANIFFEIRNQINHSGTYNDQPPF